MATRKKETDDQYTKPELREQVKAEVMAGDKGGKAGQWSARKAQLVAHEYEARGGGYKHERTEAQEHLHEWTGEHWQTSDGKPAERDGKTTRYLPEAAWEKLSPGEKQATNAKKVRGSKAGKQFVANTRAAAGARHEAEAQPKQAKKSAGTRTAADGASEPSRAKKAAPPSAVKKTSAKRSAGAGKSDSDREPK